MPMRFHEGISRSVVCKSGSRTPVRVYNRAGFLKERRMTGNADDGNRFGGIARLYGQPAQTRFAAAHVCVVGIGGVGSWVAEALARSGIGAITLIDLDDVCVTNTNRQVHALAGEFGRAKVQSMADRVRAINPVCRVQAVEEFVSRENLRALVTKDMDFVVDAIDVAGTKAALIYHCKREKIPVITTGAAGGQLDPTLVRVVDLNRTQNDPLAAKVRSILRRHYGWSRNTKRHYAVPCVYSLEQLRYPTVDGGVSCEKSWEDGPKRLDCESGFGACMTVTATFGLVAVSRVLEKLAAPRANNTQARDEAPAGEH